MKFDFCIGNPPYQEPYQNTKGSGANSIYNEFLDAAFKISDRVEMIHPARFLFNAGSTPKEWNEKMLADPHFKIMRYEPSSSVFFPMLQTPIKGGIVISYRNANEEFGAIEIFTKYEELNNILKKVENAKGFKSISTIAVSSYVYHFTEKSHEDFPQIEELSSKGHSYDLTSNCFDRLPFLFTDDKKSSDQCKILGRSENKRTYKYIKRKYINDVVNFDKYKIFVPKANGDGSFGEVFADPILAEPGVGSTETFMSMGHFETELEAQNLVKYIKCKFTRALLGVAKVTQDINPAKWKYVPLQDFGKKSDINWSKTIREIDAQLYKKYKLNESEINFIETYVKEMA